MPSVYFSHALILSKLLSEIARRLIFVHDHVLGASSQPPVFRCRTLLYKYVFFPYEMRHIFDRRKYEFRALGSFFKIVSDFYFMFYTKLFIVRLFLGFVGFRWILLDFFGFCWISLDFVGFCWISMDFVWSCWVVLNSISLKCYVVKAQKNSIKKKIVYFRRSKWITVFIGQNTYLLL